MTDVRKPFIIAAIFWAVIGFAMCRHFSAVQELPKNLVWLFGLWALCLLDLLALGKTIQGMLAIAAGAGENLSAYTVHTFSWGLIKLVCLGIFALVMIKGNPIPTAGLLVGMGTLVVVPLVGGFLWSQRALGVS
jgi:hypothetical protein